MRKNVMIGFLLTLLSGSSAAFRLFSSDAGTYKEARPFFSSTKKLVDDHYDGNLAHVSQTINAHTFVFVMYYANFCGISRRMRDPFEKAATFYRERIPHGNTTTDKFHVKFVAIDCFYHEGQCRKTYKLNYFPHMFLYVKGTRGYQYFGPTIASNLIEFVEKVRLPIARLTTVNEFFDFAVQHESHVLASFDFSNNLQRYHYSLYAQAALKHIEYDNAHPVRFAVILNQSIVDELSNLYPNTSFEKPFVVVHRLNSDPQAFPNVTNNFTMDNLFQWVINEDEHPDVGWLVPKNRYYSRSPSMDRASLADALIHNDHLLLFLTNNKLDELKLRQIYLHLSDCDGTRSSPWEDRLAALYNRSFVELTENLTRTQRHRLSTCCQHVLNQASSDDIHNLCLLNRPLSAPNLSDKHAVMCGPLLTNATWQKLCFESHCQAWLKNSSLAETKRLHPRQEIVLEKRREKLVDPLSKMQYRPIVDDRTSSEQYGGFLCQINTTWAFRLIHSRDYPNVAQNLGVSNISRAILVLQSKNEQHYLLENDNITAENIYQLVYEVSHNLRARSYASIPSTSIDRDQSNRLIELTTDTFQPVVFDSNKHVLVVYYTKWCGFCQSIWPVLFQTKKYFENFSDLLFTRIQADKHDLPWHLTTDHYPTIILFPARRKNQSIVFPTSTDSITAVSLIKFLLYHLYIPDTGDDHWCPPSNNTFLAMLSSTYVDFSQLSYLVKSFS